jgi:hypothetical protein
VLAAGASACGGKPLGDETKAFQASRSPASDAQYSLMIRTKAILYFKLYTAAELGPVAQLILTDRNKRAKTIFSAPLFLSVCLC